MHEPRVAVTLSPSIEGADLSACIGDTENSASFLICITCGIRFAPLVGEECYGKCQDCLSSHFNNFAALHLNLLINQSPSVGGPGPAEQAQEREDNERNVHDASPSLLHVVQSFGSEGGVGGPLGGVNDQSINPDDGAPNSNMNSVFYVVGPNRLLP